MRYLDETPPATDRQLAEALTLDYFLRWLENDLFHRDDEEYTYNDNFNCPIALFLRYTFPYQPIWVGGHSAKVHAAQVEIPLELADAVNSSRGTCTWGQLKSRVKAYS